MAEEREFIYLSLNAVIRMHEEMMETFGAKQTIRDLQVIESAVESPRGGFGDVEFYPDLFSKAACYAFQLAQGQGFVDGNKRIAALAALVFLELNGYEISEDFDDDLEKALNGVAKREVDREGLAETLRELVCSTITQNIKKP